MCFTCVFVTHAFSVQTTALSESNCMPAHGCHLQLYHWCLSHHGASVSLVYGLPQSRQAQFNDVMTRKFQQNGAPTLTRFRFRRSFRRLVAPLALIHVVHCTYGHVFNNRERGSGPVRSAENSFEATTLTHFVWRAVIDWRCC
jgi:hypothetical protein